MKPVARPRSQFAQILWVFVPGVVAATFARLPLAWDGSYFLVDLLDHGRPVILHGRSAMVVFQVPAAIAGHLTSNVAVLTFLFSLPYVLVPLVALWLSWRVVRERAPGLIVWAGLAIGVVTLPGQAFFVSESLMVAQLAWPLLLGVLVGYRWNRAALLALVVFLVLLHPMAAPALGVVALVAVVQARRDSGRRVELRRAGWVFGGAALVRQAMTSAGLDAETPKLGDYTHQWTWAVNGMPTVVVGSIIAAVLVVVGSCWRASRPSPLTRKAGAVAFGLLVVAFMAATLWGARTHLWRSALDYRSFVVLFGLPLAVAAVLDAPRARRGQSAKPAGAGVDVPAAVVAGEDGLRRAALVVAGLTFSCTLGLQSLGWAGLMDYARHEVAAHPPGCVVRHFAEKDGTAMRHWANPSLVLLVQGRKPRVVVVGEPSSCARLAATGELVLPRTGKQRNVFRHWFDLSEVRAALRSGR